MLKPTPSKSGLFSVACKRFSRLRGIAVITLLTVGFVLAYFITSTPLAAQAATNNTLNFQARLETASGAIVPDGNYDVTFHLYNALSSSGSTDTACNTDTNCLWEETYSYNSGSGGTDARLHVANGYMTVNLGSITAFPTTINWDQSLWLSMDIGGTTSSGTITWDGQMSPRLALTAVPYAFRAGQLAQFNSGTGFTSTLSITQPTVGNQSFVLPDMAAAGTYTLLTTGNGVQLQSTTPGTQQNGNFNISGTGLLSTLDATGSTLTLGAANATTINIGTNAIAHTIAIGTGAAVEALTIGSTNTTSSVLVQAGTGNLQIQTQGGTLGIGNNSVAQNITVGNSTGASNVTIQAGTGNAGGDINIQAAASGIINIGTAAVTGKLLNIGSVGSTVDASTVNIATSNGNATQSVSIGNTGSANNVILIQGGTSATAIQLQVGSSGTIGIANNAVSQKVTMGNTTSTSTLTLEAGTGATAIQIGNGATAHGIQIGTGAAAQTITIGSTNTSSSLLLQTGTGTLNLQTQGTGGINIGTNAVAQNIVIGNTTGNTGVAIQGGTGAINIGTQAIADVISVGNNTGATALDLTAGTGAINLNVGFNSNTNIDTGANTGVTTLGSATNTTANSVVLQANGISESFTGSATAPSDVIKTSVNSTTAFQIQSTAGRNILNVDTADGQVALIGNQNSNPTLLVEESPTCHVGTYCNAGLLSLQDTVGNPLFNVSNTGDLTVGNPSVSNSGAGRIFSDGFESGNLDLWNGGVTGNVTASTNTARTGLYAARVVNTSVSYATENIPTQSTTVMARAYVYITAASSSAQLFNFSDGTNHYGVDFTGSALSFYNNGTLIASGLGYNTAHWHEIELDITPGAGTGSATIYVDGQAASTPATSQTINNLTQFIIGDMAGTDTGNSFIDDVSLDTVQTGQSDDVSLSDSFHVSGTSSFGSAVLVQPSSNTTNAFQVENSSGANLFTVDTTNTALVLGNDNTPSALTVRGGAASGNNLNGANITFQASNGTGAGGSGSFIFQTAKAAGNAVGVDNSGTTNITGGTTATLSYTDGSNSSRLLLVQMETLNTRSFTGVTYNGVAMTQLTTKTSGSVRTELWYLINPASGTHNIVATEGTAGAATLAAASFYNVDQTTPLGTAATASGTTSGTQPTSMNVTTTSTAQLVFNAIGIDTASASLANGSSGQTVLWNYVPGSGIFVTGGAYQTATGGTTNVSWNVTTADWTNIGVPINPTTNTSADTLSTSFVINNAGNIGIDNANPQYSLDVAGTSRFQTATNSSTAFQIQNTSSQNLFLVDTSGSTVSIGATGSTALATTVNIATSSGAAQTVAIGSTNGSSATTINAGTGNITLNGFTQINQAGIPLAINTTGATPESGLLYQVSGTTQGEIGIAGSTGHIVNQTAVNDLGVKSINGNILFAAGSSSVALTLQTNGNLVLNSGALVLYNASSAPTEVNGAMYYNTTDNTFECGVSGNWTSCGNGVLGVMTSNSNSVTSASYTSFGSGASFTPPSGDCQPGVSYLITAYGYSNSGSTNTSIALDFALFQNGTDIEDEHNEATDTSVGDNLNHSWSLNMAVTCQSLNSVMVQGFTTSDGNRGAGFQVPAGNARSGAIAITAGGSFQLEGRWRTAPGGTGAALVVTNFVAQRLAP